MLRTSLDLMGAAGADGLAACNPFRSPFKQSPVVEVTTRDANANARRNATLASPSNLVGAVQMKGSAAMTPGSNAGNTRVSVDLSNAPPGGVHPWQVRRGQCGMDDGAFGETDTYMARSIDDQGRAASSATVGLTMPTEGRYYVRVGASAANPETIVACGNLAPPSQ